MSNVTIYLIGTLIVAVGVFLGFRQLGVGMTWTLIALLFVIGFGLMGAVKAGRKREDSPGDE